MKNKRLLDEYTFPGFKPMRKIKGIFGDCYSIIISLQRNQKKRYVAVAGQNITDTMTRKLNWFEIYHVVQKEFSLKLKAVV